MSVSDLHPPPALRSLVCEATIALAAFGAAAEQIKPGPDVVTTWGGSPTLLAAMGSTLDETAIGAARHRLRWARTATPRWRGPGCWGRGTSARRRAPALMTAVDIPARLRDVVGGVLS